MKTILYIAFVFIAWSAQANSQYAPAAGDSGSTAVYKDSSIFTAWGNTCKIERGFIKISDTTLAYEGSTKATLGNADDALGKADGKVVSLGDGGAATYSLDTAIMDKDGYDFAVFENGFKAQEPPQHYFLELAFVEVSSDGSRFVRFPAVSETAASTQLTTFGQIDPSNIHNLAGKYAANYGTPFDLRDLSDSVGIDIKNIRHIRIIDVIGNISDAYASHDVHENKINDPWPTPFASGGFDLDALGIIHLKDKQTDISSQISENNLLLHPNPVKKGQCIRISRKNSAGKNNMVSASVFNASGTILIHTKLHPERGNDEISIPLDMNTGIYFIQISGEGNLWHKKIMITE